ncbi:hypothetical protein X801_03339, partial [Opisthorchis viverrini]
LEYDIVETNYQQTARLINQLRSNHGHRRTAGGQIDKSHKVGGASRMNCAMTHLHNIIVQALRHDGRTCKVVYEYVPNLKAFELNPLCIFTAQNVTKNAIVSAFGFQWGCPHSRMSVDITPYYSVILHVNEEETSGVSVTHRTKCIVNSLNYEANTTVDCLMNEYGGYGWSLPDPNGLCRLEEFENISSELIEILRESVVFCSYRMFLYIGYLNSRRNAKIASDVVGALSQECENSPAWIFDSMYFDFLHLMDVILYTYCNDDRFVAHANESFPMVFELLDLFVDKLKSYYDIRTERLFHRSRMFHVHAIPWEELQSTQITCGEQFNITIVKAIFPLTVACTEHLHALAENDLFEMFLTVGFLKIQPKSEKVSLVYVSVSCQQIYGVPDVLVSLAKRRFRHVNNNLLSGSEQLGFHWFTSVDHETIHFNCISESDYKFEVVIRYNLPEFHQPSEYFCARYEDTTPLTKSSFGGCRLETVRKYTVSCRCLSPGYYALLQASKREFRRKNIEFSEQTNDSRRAHWSYCCGVSLHCAVWHRALVTSCIGSVLQEPNAYCTKMVLSPQKQKRKGFSGTQSWNASSAACPNPSTASCHFSNVEKKLCVFHVASPTMPKEVNLSGNRKTIEARKEENCKYGARNTSEDSKMSFPGTVQHVLQHLLNVFNVLGGTVVFVANRVHRIQKIIWKISLAVYALAIAACVLLYLFHGTHYNQLNCLPDDFMGGMVYPSVALNILAFVFLSLFWCSRPYRNIDEWFGILLNVIISLYLWVHFAVRNEYTYSFRMQVVRLMTLTLAHAIVCTVYQCLIKPSMVMWYWSLSKAVYQSVLPKLAQSKDCSSSQSEHRQSTVSSKRSGDPATQRPSIS